MPTLESLRNRLTKPRDLIAPIWQPIDVKTEARARKLAELGREDGLRNFPAADAVDQTAIEQQLIGDVTVQRDRSLAALVAHLRAYRDSLSQLQTAMKVAGLRQEADDSVRRLREIRAEWSGETGSLRKRATEAEEEYQDFRRVHGLRRGARVPKDFTLSIASLVAFAMVESVLNGTFFAAGSDSGLVGGVTLALAISLVNVVVGALNGYFCLRGTNRRNLVVASLNWIAFLTLVCAAILFNALIAHYRDAYQISGDATAIPAIWQGLVVRPFGLVSLQSWLLLGLGLLAAGFSIWKGYSMDDPYPGYSGHERRRIASAQRYNQHRIALIDDASETNENYSAKALDAIDSLRSDSAERSQIQGSRARSLSEYQMAESDLASAARQLLAIYREANLKARTEPAPEFFSRTFDFDEKGLDRQHVRLLLIDQGFKHDADSLISELDTLRAKVMSEHDITLAAAPSELTH